MPILGVIASGISGHLTPPDTGAMFPLGMVSVGSGGTSTITFSSIPSTYKHLQIRMSYNNLTGLDNMKMVLNGSVNSTRYHWLYADGSSAAATSNTTNLLTYQAGRSDTQQYAAIVDILEYANTSINKTIRTLGGVDNNFTSTGSYLNSIPQKDLLAESYKRIYHN